MVPPVLFGSGVWSAIGVKIVFKMSALCGEYISQRIYKYVDVYNKYVDLLYISQRIYKYVDVYNKYVDLLINAATYLLYCTVLYCTVLYYIILYCTVLVFGQGC